MATNDARMNEVILVDEQDRQVGVAEKLAAHRGGGRLHRAFSVFVFNADGELLLQQRAEGKYHFGGLWSNTCCGHPRPGEDTTSAACRRLAEEFGFETDLREIGSFIYRAHDATSGLTEQELDHVFVGEFDGAPAPDPAEIDEWRWTAPAEVQRDLAERPDRLTPWFEPALRFALSRHTPRRRSEPR